MTTVRKNKTPIRKGLAVLDDSPKAVTKIPDTENSPRYTEPYDGSLLEENARVSAIDTNLPKELNKLMESSFPAYLSSTFLKSWKHIFYPLEEELLILDLSHEIPADGVITNKANIRLALANEYNIIEVIILITPTGKESKSYTTSHNFRPFPLNKISDIRIYSNELKSDSKRFILEANTNELHLAYSNKTLTPREAYSRDLVKGLLKEPSFEEFVKKILKLPKSNS